MSILELCLYGITASVIWMSFLWIVSEKIKNAAIVDVGWGVSVFLYAFIYFFFTNTIQPKEALVLLVVGVWSSRLSSYLFFERILGHSEEGRYLKLREYFKTNISFKFYLFFQSQALFNFLLSIPFLIISQSVDQSVSMYHVIGFMIALTGVWGETLSDEQLKEFKLNPSNKGKVCDVGLWSVSRHPNYFFEFLVWVGFAWMALLEPYGFMSIIAPSAILYTLLKFTGIPATEAQAVRSKGELYINYQKRVSAFVPWFPRKN